MAGPSFPRSLFVVATLLHLLGPSAAADVDAQQQPDDSYPCPGGPGEGCANGLFSPALCVCECIPPFCRDSLGACSSAGHCDSVNPWIDCAIGTNCPWWDNAKLEERCATGPEAPPGVWTVHASREACCNTHHPNSLVCNPDRDDGPRPTGPAPEYELIPIRFVVTDLPGEVDVRELKAEMAKVLRRVLTDLAKGQKDLKVTAIEENILKSPRNDEDDSDANDEKRVVYYDVSTLRHPHKEFGPIIILGLRDSYGEIIEYFEHYEDMKYFGYGVDFYWCIDNEDEQSWAKCSMLSKTVTDDFRLANLPRRLDVEKLMRQMKLIYRALFDGIERLDILDVEEEVVNVSSDGGWNHTRDVIFDIRVAEKYGMSSFVPAVEEVLQRPTTRNNILDGIQTYTDAETDLTLDWFINSEGAYAVRQEPEPEPKQPFVFPTWAIITLAASGAVLLCCIVCCIMIRIRIQDEINNERNMVTYLQTGRGYTKPGNKGPDYHHRQRPRPPPQYPPHPSRRRKRPRTEDDGRGPAEDGRPRPKPRRPSGNKTHENPSNQYRRRLKNYHEEMQMSSDDMQRSLEEMKVRPHRHASKTKKKRRKKKKKKVPRKDTEYQMEHMQSFVFDNGGDDSQPPLRLEDDPARSPAPQHEEVSRKKTDWEYENMPSFIFDDGGGNGNRPPQRPAPRKRAECSTESMPSREFDELFDIADGEGRSLDDDDSASRPDPDGNHVSAMLAIDDTHIVRRRRVVRRVVSVSDS